jgi:glycosyltransferase involved in cell wall biosynthesis
MCFLDEERFIGEAIQSVLAQTYTRWELILVDDGSTDHSTAIAKEFAATYPDRIVYKEHEGHLNKGTSISRNWAVRIAKGELITFLDGDDVLLPDMLSQLYSLMQQQQVPIVIEASKYWYSWLDAEKNDSIQLVGVQQDKLYSPFQLLVQLYPLGSGMAPCICGILMRKDVFERYGGFDEAFEGMYEDQTLLTKLYLNEKIFVSSGCHNWYRQNQGSLVDSSRRSGKYFHDRQRFLRWLEIYLSSQGIKSLQVQLLLYKAWLPYKHPVQHFVFIRVPNKMKSISRSLFHVSEK